MAYQLYRSLVERQEIIPYVQTAFKSFDNWPTPQELMLDNPYQHDSREDAYYHPSVHADECALGCYLRLHPVERTLLKPEEISFTAIMTPFVGTFIHKVIQKKLVNDGIVTEEDIEVPLVDEDRHWRGHADLRIHSKLCDIKTMKQDNFKFLKAPKDSWRYQLNPYMDKMELQTSLILVVELGHPYRMQEYRINRDERILDEIYSKWEFVSESIKRDIPPSHDGCENRWCTVRTRT